MQDKTFIWTSSFQLFNMCRSRDVFWSRENRRAEYYVEDNDGPEGVSELENVMLKTQAH